MSVIRVMLRGGLGNQFFQLLYAKHLSNNGWNVRLNSMLLRKRSGNQARGEVELNRLFVDVGFMVEAWRGIGDFEVVFSRLGLLCGLVDGDANYPVSNNRLAPIQYGYYQTSSFASEQIIRNLKTSLRSSFLSPPLQEPYCVMHIRGGDYATGRYNSQEIGRLAIDYYLNTFRLIDSKWPDYPLIIVSDDYSAAVKIKMALMPIAGKRSIHILSDFLGRPESSDDALSAMLGAKVLATANSSFSAMAGYLNNVFTIAPHPWFRGQRLNEVDPCMHSWIRVPAIFDSET